MTGPIAPSEKALRKAGIRLTKPRRLILQILAEAEDHPDATEIFERAVKLDKRLSLSTGYRTMTLLEDPGAI